MNLGEASQSYGFGGTSKAVTNSVFVDYGESFGPGDVIGCFVVSRGGACSVGRCARSLTALSLL